MAHDHKPEDVARSMLEGPTVEIIGPFRGDIYYMTVDGCKVPHVHLCQRDDVEEDWTLVVDDRFAADVNHDEVLRWGYAFANFGAVCAGYSCHGPNSRPFNRFAMRMVGLGSVPGE